MSGEEAIHQSMANSSHYDLQGSVVGALAVYAEQRKWSCEQHLFQFHKGKFYLQVTQSTFSFVFPHLGRIFSGTPGS